MGDPPSRLMVQPVVEQVAALAKAFQIARPIVTRIVVGATRQLAVDDTLGKVALGLRRSRPAHPAHDHLGKVLRLTSATPAPQRLRLASTCARLI